MGYCGSCCPPSTPAKKSQVGHVPFNWLLLCQAPLGAWGKRTSLLSIQENVICSPLRLSGVVGRGMYPNICSYVFSASSKLLESSSSKCCDVTPCSCKALWSQAKILFSGHGKMRPLVDFQNFQTSPKIRPNQESLYPPSRKKTNSFFSSLHANLRLSWPRKKAELMLSHPFSVNEWPGSRVSKRTSWNVSQRSSRRTGRGCPMEQHVFLTPKEVPAYTWNLWHATGATHRAEILGASHMCFWSETFSRPRLGLAGKNRYYKTAHFDFAQNIFECLADTEDCFQRGPSAGGKCPGHVDSHRRRSGQSNPVSNPIVSILRWTHQMEVETTCS